MRPDTAAALAEYQSLIDTVTSSGDEIRRLSMAKHPSVREWEGKVEVWRMTNRSRAQKAWDNAKAGLERAEVPVPDLGTLEPPAVPPTAADLEAARDFAPAMAEIEKHLPGVVKFQGYRAMRGDLWSFAFLAWVLSVVIAFTPRAQGTATMYGPPGITEQGPAWGALLILGNCLGWAAFAWYSVIRPAAREGGWSFTDARHVGAIFLTVFLNTLGGAVAAGLILP